MGGAKKVMMEHQSAVVWAVGVLEAAGYGKQCEVHPGIYIETDASLLEDVVDASRANVDRPGGYDSDDELASLFEEASQAFGEECGHCGKNQDD